MIFFDHIEIHVLDPLKYCNFLVSLFGAGRYKKISENGTYMFLSPDQHRFEIKTFRGDVIVRKSPFGFCMPCLRTNNAKNHLAGLNVKITSEIQNPDGPCVFFEDYEGVKWHIKSYDQLDEFINI